MLTEKPSQQITPLPEEHTEPPAPVLAQEVQPHPTPQSPVWWLPWIDVGKAVLLWVASVLLLLFVPVLVALPYLVYKIIAFGAPSPEALGTDKFLIFFSVVGIIPTHILTLLIIWMFVTAGGRYPFWKTLGFEWPRTGPVFSGLLSFFLAIVLLLIAWVITSYWGGSKTDLDLLIESSLYTRFATAVVAVATAPLVEEVLYRGVLYSAIEKAAGVGIAIGAVSLLFAGVHVVQYRNNIAVIAVITLLSFTLTVVRALTGKVLPAFIIHFVFNGIQSLILVLAPFIDKNTG